MDIGPSPITSFSVLFLIGIVAILSFLLAIFLNKVDKSENEKV